MRPFIAHRGSLRRPAAGAGFTLIENMVALAVFAIGMLAIVYLFLYGIGASRTSQSLTQAYVAMQEIVGMMRADSAQALMYKNIDTQAGASQVLPATNTIPATNVATWMNSLKALPGAGNQIGGYGKVTVTSAPTSAPGTCPCDATIEIVWAGGEDKYVVQTVVGY